MSRNSDQTESTHESGGRGELTGRFRTVQIVAVVATVVAAVAGAFATGWVEQIFADDPPASCPGTDCDGRNPKAVKCDDVFTYKPTEGNPAALQIRYSKRCKAVWGKIEAGEPGDRVSITVPGHPKRERQEEIDYGDDQFTKMITVNPADFSATVCVITGPEAQRESTWEGYCLPPATERSAWY